MYNPSDPQAGFQQLAMQAMVASSVQQSAAAYQHRLSDASEAPSAMGSPRADSTFAGSPMGGRRRPQRQSVFPARAAPRPTMVEMGELHEASSLRPPRPSVQARRSEQVYAARRSVANLGADRYPVAAARASVAGLSPTTDDAKEDAEDFYWEVDGAEIAPEKRGWRWTWIAILLLISTVFSAAGALYLVYGSDSMINSFQIWRLCFFIAGLPVIWLVGGAVTFASVWIVERSLFKVKNALYYAYAVRRPLANVLRAALSLGWWAFSMMAWNGKQEEGVREAVDTLLRVWACVTLFMTASLLKTLLAKVLSSKFNKESHMRKIQDALVKEYYLRTLLKPRERESTLDGGGDSFSADGLEAPLQGDKTQPGDLSSPRNQIVHANASPVRSPGATLGNAIATSVRGVTQTLFGTRGNEAGSMAEELLNSAGALSPVDVEAPAAPNTGTPAALHRQPKLSEFQAEAGREVPRVGLVRPSRMHSSAGHTTAGRIPSAVEGAAAMGPAGQRRASLMLAPLAEEAAAKEAVRSRTLNANQLARMETYVRKNAMHMTFRDELHATERQEDVTSEAEAKKLAFFLFWNVKADLERSVICLDDTLDFLSPEEAEEAFAMLDRNGNGSVTLNECIAAVTEIFAARCDLALSLSDTKTIIGKLESVIGVVVHVSFLFLYMLVFNMDVIKTYLALSSLILAFAFIFQNSIRTMYENVVFLFFVHPFDVDDVLKVGEGDLALTYKVDQIDLLYTVMLSINGARTWYPNQKLIITPFSNMSASGERSDTIKVMVDFDTSISALDAVRAGCEATAIANPTEFCEGVTLRMSDAAAPLKVSLVLGFKYTTNGSDGARTANARTAMHKALCQALAESGVNYTNPPTRDYIVMDEAFGEPIVVPQGRTRVPNMEIPDYEVKKEG